MVVTRHILVVEDDEQLSEILSYRLELEEYTVTVIGDGDESLSFLDEAPPEERPDAILLDVMLPGADGFSILKHLAADDRYADVPVILVTGRGLEDDVVRGFELGADDYVVKPFSPSEVVVRLDRLLS